MKKKNLLILFFMLFSLVACKKEKTSPSNEDTLKSRRLEGSREEAIPPHAETKSLVYYRVYLENYQNNSSMSFFGVGTSKNKFQGLITDGNTNKSEMIDFGYIYTKEGPMLFSPHLIEYVEGIQVNDNWLTKNLTSFEVLQFDDNPDFFWEIFNNNGANYLDVHKSFVLGGSGLFTETFLGAPFTQKLFQIKTTKDASRYGRIYVLSADEKGIALQLLIQKESL